MLEYRGSAIRALTMEERMTVCNMSIEAGARAGMIAPDDITFAYLKGRPRAPQGADWDAAVARWRALASDPGASFDASVDIDASTLEPMITYGTNPGMVVSIGSSIPDKAGNEVFDKALKYMGFHGGDAMLGKKVDVVFIGSCTNGRLADLQAAASILKGRKVAPGVRLLIVPGSQSIKREAEEAGYADIFKAAGADWRESGCSMCLGMNGDPGPRRSVLDQHQQSEFRGPSGRRSPHLAGQPPDRGRQRRAGTHHRSPGVDVVEPVTRVRSKTVVIPSSNIDTDQIIPARFLTTTTKEGLGLQLFADWRYRADGSPNPDFVLNRPEARGAQVLIAGRNFGCGSSREHAPWALLDNGFRAVVSTEIADIFTVNSLKNGLLPVVVDEATSQWLLDHPGAEVDIDVKAATLTLPTGAVVSFPIDAFARHCLVNGIDELGYLRSRAGDVERYEAARSW